MDPLSIVTPDVGSNTGSVINVSNTGSKNSGGA